MVRLIGVFLSRSDLCDIKQGRRHYFSNLQCYKRFTSSPPLLYAFTTPKSQLYMWGNSVAQHIVKLKINGRLKWTILHHRSCPDGLRNVHGSTRSFSEVVFLQLRLVGTCAVELDNYCSGTY